MHCMDSDYSVFSILPPYNTIEAQLIVNGALVTNGTGYTVTYQAVADPDGSINTTSIGKGNFYTYTRCLYGAVAPDMGLAGLGDAGPGQHRRKAMLFEAANSPAAGVPPRSTGSARKASPSSPFDDAMHRNTYPLMRLVARDSANAAVATSDIVLPVSDEMDCRACHASGTQAAAQAVGRLGLGRPTRSAITGSTSCACTTRRSSRSHAGAIRGGAGGARLQSRRALRQRGRRRQAGRSAPPASLGSPAGARLSRAFRR